MTCTARTKQNHELPRPLSYEKVLRRRMTYCHEHLTFSDSLPLKTSERRQRWSNATFFNRQQHCYFIVVKILPNSVRNYFYLELNNATARTILYHTTRARFPIGRERVTYSSEFARKSSGRNRKKFMCQSRQTNKQTRPVNKFITWFKYLFFFSPQGNFEGFKETKLNASLGTNKLVEIG